MSTDALTTTVHAHQRKPTTVRTYERRRANWSPAARERLAEKISALWSDPAYRAEMQRRMKAGWARREARLDEQLLHSTGDSSTRQQ